MITNSTDDNDDDNANDDGDGSSLMLYGGETTRPSNRVGGPIESGS